MNIIISLVVDWTASLDSQVNSSLLLSLTRRKPCQLVGTLTCGKTLKRAPLPRSSLSCSFKLSSWYSSQTISSLWQCERNASKYGMKTFSPYCKKVLTARGGNILTTAAPSRMTAEDLGPTEAISTPISRQDRMSDFFHFRTQPLASDSDGGNG